MEFETVLRGRRSVRAYADEPVSDELITEILDAARWSPSWRNTQAWSVWVVTGDALDHFKDRFKQAVRRDEPAAPDFLPAADWPAACSLRTKQLMDSRNATLAAAGFGTDTETAMARMANLFDAPCLLVFGVEEVPRRDITRCSTRGCLCRACAWPLSIAGWARASWRRSCATPSSCARCCRAATACAWPSV